MVNVQDVDDARRDEEERAHRSDQMRKDRAAVCLSIIYQLITVVVIVVAAAVFHVLAQDPYLTLGRAGYYTCPALRPYQFGPMCNPDVTEVALTLPYLTFGVGRLLHLPSAEAVSTEFGVEAESSPAT